MSNREAQIRPPMLDGSNYAYWKTRMTAYIKSLDDRAWRNVIVKWQPPQRVDENGNLVMKDEAAWTADEDKASAANSKALNAIFGAVEPEVYGLISQCVSAKEAWDTLQLTFEGTDKVKDARMQMVTLKFENLKMRNDESVTEFISRLMEISNEAQALGEPIGNERLVKKTLRALPQKFSVLRLSLGQTRDLKTLTLAELFGELKSFEVDLEGDVPEKKTRSLALKSSMTDSDDDSDDEQMALMSKAFTKFMRYQRKRSDSKTGSASRNQRDNKFRSNKGSESEKEVKGDKGKGIQCRECEGYGHIQKECATFLKKQKKGLTVSWSESDESDSEQEGCKALTTVFNKSGTWSDTDSDSDQRECIGLTAVTEDPESDQVASKSQDSAKSVSSSDSESELSEEALADRFEVLFGNWKEVVQINSTLKGEKKELLEKVRCLTRDLDSTKLELKFTKSELERVNKFVKMMSKPNKLDEVLKVQRSVKDNSGLGYVDKPGGKSVFVPAKPIGVSDIGDSSV